MRRNYILDTLLLVLSVILGVTGIALWENSSQCAHAGFLRQKSLTAKRRPVLKAHRVMSLTFLLITVLHLLWHWRWITECTPRVLHGEEE